MLLVRSFEPSHGVLLLAKSDVDGADRYWRDVRLAADFEQLLEYCSRFRGTSDPSIGVS